MSSQGFLVSARRLGQEELSQNTIEYILVLGVFVTALAAAFIAGRDLVLPQILDMVCPTVDPVNLDGNCLCLTVDPLSLSGPCPTPGAS